MDDKITVILFHFESIHDFKHLIRRRQILHIVSRSKQSIFMFDICKIVKIKTYQQF